MVNIDFREDEKYPIFNDNQGELVGGGSSSSSVQMYYAEVKINFKKNNTSIGGVTYNGSYTSFYSNGSSATNTIYRSTLGENTNSVILYLYSYTAGKQGILTINASTSGSSVETTARFAFNYSTKAGMSNRTGQEDKENVFEINLVDGNVILPSIYKPFYFNAALKIDSVNKTMDFYCSIANPIGYRQLDGNYVMGTPVLSIDNEKFYFYSDGADFDNTTVRQEIKRYFPKNLIVSNEELTNKYFYAPLQNALIGNDNEIRFSYQFVGKIFERNIPHNFSFTVTEGAPEGYSGSLEIKEIEDTLYGVKFYDKLSALNEHYLYSEGRKSSGIRNFFVEDKNSDNKNENEVISSALSSITCYNYSYDPETWRSIHTYIYNNKAVKMNLYDTEVPYEDKEASTVEGVPNKHHHFIIPNDNTKRHYYYGIIDKYTMLDGENIASPDESSYGRETWEDPQGAYTQVPRHTSVLSVIDYVNII